MAAQFNGFANSQYSKAIKLHVEASPSKQPNAVVKAEAEDEAPIGQTKKPENAGGVQIETGAGAVVGGKSSVFVPFSKRNDRHQIPLTNLLRGQRIRSEMVSGNASSAGSSKSNPMATVDSRSDKNPNVDEGDAFSVIQTTNSSTNGKTLDTFVRASPRTHAVIRAVNMIGRVAMPDGSAAPSTVTVQEETPQIPVEQFEQPKSPEYLVLFPLEAPLFPVQPEQLGWRSTIDKQERRNPSTIARRFKAFSRASARGTLADGGEVDLNLRLG